MTKKIAISKNEIINKYNSLSGFFVAALESFYDEVEKDTLIETYILDAESLMSEDGNGNNNLSGLDCAKDKIGIYVFIDEENNPVYVGKGGTSRNADQKSKDLKYRISQQINRYKGNDQNTLSKNIMEIDGILSNTEVSSIQSLNVIRRLKIKVFILGDRTSDSANLNDITRKAEALETLFIALLPTKYNK